MCERGLGAVGSIEAAIRFEKEGVIVRFVWDGVIVRQISNGIDDVMFDFYEEFLVTY